MLTQYGLSERDLMAAALTEQEPPGTHGDQSPLSGGPFEAQGTEVQALFISLSDYKKKVYAHELVRHPRRLSSGKEVA